MQENELKVIANQKWYKILMNRVVPPLVNVDDYKAQPLHCDLKKQKLLKFVYGTDDEIPMSMPLTRPPSPTSALAKAGEFVLKSQTKGYLPKMKKGMQPHDIYKDNLVPMFLRERAEMERKRKEHKHLGPSEKYKEEPFQDFWQTSHIVMTSCEEIQQLPFMDKQDIPVTEGKLREDVASYVRVLNHKGLLNFKNKTRQQLAAIMLDFVKEVQKIRYKLIDSCFKNGIINKMQIPQKYKDEFPQHFPKQDTTLPQLSMSYKLIHQKDNPELEKKIVMTMLSRLDRLPETYKVIHFPDNDKVKAAKKEEFQKHLLETTKLIDFELSAPPSRCPATQPVSPRGIGIPVKRHPNIISQPFTRQNSRTCFELENKAEEEEEEEEEYMDASVFWRATDPLKNLRGGDYIDPLQQMSQIADEFKINVDEYVDDGLEVEIPFQLSAPPRVPTNTTPKKDEDDDEDTFDENDLFKKKNDNNNRRLSLVEASNSAVGSFNVLRNISQVNYDTEANKTKDMQYLINQSIMLIDNSSEDQVHEKLKQIWSELGFNFNQKIEMLVKYTKNTDEGSKLTDALSYWEEAYAAFIHYDHVYQDIKDFFRIEYHHSNGKGRISYQHLEQDLCAAETSIRSVADSLKRMFQDELIIKKKRAADLMIARRKKIAIIKQDVGFDDNENAK